MTTTATPAAGEGLPDHVEKVFEAVRRAQWLAQVTDEVGENGIDDLPRHELWRAISERLAEARAAVDEATELVEEAAA